MRLLPQLLLLSNRGNQGNGFLALQTVQTSVCPHSDLSSPLGSGQNLFFVLRTAPLQTSSASAACSVKLARRNPGAERTQMSWTCARAQAARCAWRLRKSAHGTSPLMMLGPSVLPPPRFPPGGFHSFFWALPAPHLPRRPARPSQAQLATSSPRGHDGGLFFPHPWTPGPTSFFPLVVGWGGPAPHGLWAACLLPVTWLPSVTADPPFHSQGPQLRRACLDPSPAPPALVL